MPPPIDPALTLFHPLVADWFGDRVGTPTDVQARAWPEIAAGRHILVTAPTGSGKTLTAFLWGLNQLITGAWDTGVTRMLYVSPLKALNTDIRRNLNGPLAELRAAFDEAAQPFPELHVQTRSGDTDPRERRQMLRHPPEILVTTPESLNLLLSSPKGRDMLSSVETVILDEIHAVAGTKRGTHLITAVERLVLLAGEFQRVALSATVRPLETVAEFVGGYRLAGLPGAARYEPREVTLVRGEQKKRYETVVRAPLGASGGNPVDAWWPALTEDLRTIIRRNRSTLIFANSRRLCEKLALRINEGESQPLAYAHHGSLSREARAVVEGRLKAGELSAIIATSSLELGIDIGSLDEVVLVETPPDVSSSIQRLGRAGHGVGQVSHGDLFPLHGRDFLEAAVMTRCIEQQDLEATHPISAPLDVLAQVIVSMVGVEAWDIDHLYEFLRACAPYHELSRRQYDLVLAMLAGRYAETRLQGLEARITIDHVDNLLRARDNALRLVYQSGGTIPDRGYYALRIEDSGVKIGELDEEFVWERRAGDTFVLGTQAWRIESITPNDVFVSRSASAAGAPFWRAEPQIRSSHFSTRVAEFLEAASVRDGRDTLLAQLETSHGMTRQAADHLVRMLEGQELATGAELPHRHHLVLEFVLQAGPESAVETVVLHTFWGGSVNQPYALALAAAWEERFGTAIAVYADNDCLAFMLPQAATAQEILSLVTSAELDDLLRRRLESSGIFGARFRENAARALLLTRGTPDRRMPLWLSRMRGKKMLEAVARYEDFPIVTETWRTCLQDEFELEVLRQRLEELEAGLLRWSEARTLEPSPLAEGVIWKQVNDLMYVDDTPDVGRTSLSEDLLREVVFSPHLRPELPAELVAGFQAKLQRTHPGYAPRTADELLELVMDRVLIPEDEWTTLGEAMAREGTDVLGEMARKLVRLTLPATETTGIAAAEAVPRLLGALGLTRAAARIEALEPGARPAVPKSLPTFDDETDPLTELLAQWLQFYGPVAPERITALFGLSRTALEDVLAGLSEAERVVVDHLTREGPPIEVCDADHLERLLRLARRAQAPLFEPLPASRLALFLADRHGLARRGTGTAGLQRAFDPLLGVPAPAAAWETDILPARLTDYQPTWLDGLMQETGLLWLGCGPKQVTLVLPDMLPLVRESVGEASFELPPGRTAFTDLQAATGQPSAALTEALWSAAWAGRITNDSFLALRRAIETRFAAPTADGTHRGLSRWQAARPFTGQWYTLPLPEPPEDALDELELGKERVRLLADRYGVLFRELLARELPALQWGRLFRTMRLMELSGELLAGYYFEGVGGLQFTTPAGLVALRKRLPADAVYWLNATDPASLCGVHLDGIDPLPDRRASTALVYRGETVVVIARRNGKDLEIRVPPDDPNLSVYLAFLGERQRRACQPLGNLSLDTINDEPAARSPYLDALRASYRVTAGYRDVKIWRQPK